MANLGKDTVTDLSDSINCEDTGAGLRGTFFSGVTNNIAYSLSAYVTCSAAAHSANGALYIQDPGSTTNSLVATTEILTIPVTDTAWVTFNFVSPPTLTQYKTYAFGIVASATDGALLLHNITAGGDPKDTFAQSVPYPEWPANSFASASFTTNLSYVYITYELPARRGYMKTMTKNW